MLVSHKPSVMGFTTRSERTEGKTPEFLQGFSRHTGIDTLCIDEAALSAGSLGKGCSISGQDFPIREACSTKCNTASLESRWSVEVSPTVVVQRV